MKNRALFIIGGLILLVVLCAAVGAGGWYLASPLFIDTVVDEGLPFDLPSAEALAGMSEEELQALEVELLAAAADMPEKVMEEPMPAPAADAQPELILQGEFQDADSFHQGTGQAQIFQLRDGSHLLRFDGFEVTNGPDLHVLLVEHPAPADRAEVMAGYLDLGSLKGNIGSQNYKIPAGADISRFQSVVIYCEPFHVVFSTAALG
jgi:hypothetical protein